MFQWQKMSIFTKTIHILQKLCYNLENKEGLPQNPYKCHAKSYMEFREVEGVQDTYNAHVLVVTNITLLDKCFQSMFQSEQRKRF